MVAPKYGPTEDSSSSDRVQDVDAMRNEKRREQVLLRLVAQASTMRAEGNTLFKRSLYAPAEIKYSKAIHMLQKIPGEMAAADLVKALNNRGRAYVKLNKMDLADIDASEVLSMKSVEQTAMSAAYLVRYHARKGLGEPQDAQGDLNRAAGLGNVDAKRLLSLSKNGKAGNGGSSSSSSSNNNNGYETGNNGGGFYGSAANSKPSPANTAATPRVRVPAEGARETTARAAEEAAAAARRRAVSAAASRGGAASSGGGGSGVEGSTSVRLKVRPGARAGEELSFGGGSSDSPYGVRCGGGGGGGSDGRDGAHFASFGGGNRTISGTYTSCEDGGMGRVSGTPRRRRPRPRPAVVPQGDGGGNSGKALAAFTIPDERKTGDTHAVEEERDTFPAPHPVLTHPSVRRCFAAADDGASKAGAAAVPSGTVCREGGEQAPAIIGSSDGDQTEEVEGEGEGQGDRALPEAAGGGESSGVDQGRAKGSAEGASDLPGDARQTLDVHHDRAKSEVQDGGGEEGSVGGGGGSSDVGGGGDEDIQRREKENAAEPAKVSEGSGVGSVEDEGPPPATQAKLVRWLVAQEKDKKHCEGDVWAVLDKKWWQKWQVYTGCDERADSGDGDVSNSNGAEDDASSTSSAPAGAAGAAVASANVAAVPAGSGETGNTGDVRGGGTKGDQDEAAAKAVVGRDSLRRSGEGVASTEDGAGEGGGGGGEEARNRSRPKSAAPHPGPIDNSNLVLDAGTPGTIPGTGRRLRLRLVRGYHFVVIPQEAWIALHAWYGGGPALPRALVPIRDSETGDVFFEPQLYPEFSRLDPVLRPIAVSVGDGGSFREGGRTANGRPASNGPLSNGPLADGDFPNGPLQSTREQKGERTDRPGQETDGEAEAAASSAAAAAAGGPPLPPPPPPFPAPEVSRDERGDISVGLGSGDHDERTEEKVAGNGEARGEGGGGDGEGMGGQEAETERGEKRETRAKARPLLRHPCAACGLPASKKCNACFKPDQRVFYCSPSCQRAHWRFHKRFCGGRNSSAGMAQAKRGKAGLENLGNTCFLNSAVQCLSHVQPLTRHLLSNKFQEDLNLTNPLGTGGRLVQAYEQVLKELWFGSGSSVSPITLKNAIARFAPQFNGFSQQDSQEVLSFLLDGLHEDLNRVPKKPYLTLPDGECGRPDSIIAAESWEMFGMRDKSVLVESLYGQFKSTLECQQCGKLSRKFDEFNVMPVELLDGQLLHVVMDFAPLLNPSAVTTRLKNDAGEDTGTPSAAWHLGGGGMEGRKQRRIGTLLPRESTVADLKAELARMFSIGVEEMVIVASPRHDDYDLIQIVHDSHKILPFMGDYEFTAHECVPGYRHALVFNRVFEGGRHVSSPEQARAEDPLARWTEEAIALSRLRGEDREAPFLLSFPENVSCLRLLEIMWDYMRDYLHLTEQEYHNDRLGYTFARSGHIKVSDINKKYANYVQVDEREVASRDRSNGVVVTGMGRYIPPTDDVLAADVLDAYGNRDQGLDFLRLEWSGFLLNNLNQARVHHQCFGHDHPSNAEANERSKKVSLQDCLQKFSVPETLCEDNSWYCGHCKELRQAVKTIQVWSLPEVLILHFKRFSHAGPTRGKVELFVDFPINGLDMSPYCLGETLEGGRPMSALYDLFAVSNHMGGMGHGHYTACVRDWEGSGMSSKWHLCDDNECTEVDEWRVRTPHAYVLFYRRRPLA